MRSLEAEECDAIGSTKPPAGAIFSAHFGRQPTCTQPKANKQGQDCKDERNKEVFRYFFQRYKGTKQKNPKSERKSGADPPDKIRGREAIGSRATPIPDPKSLQQSLVEQSLNRPVNIYDLS
jgi:hypothetical protein